MIFSSRSLIALIFVFVCAGCSPIGDFEDALENTESKIKHAYFKKSVDKTKEKIISLGKDNQIFASVVNENVISDEFKDVNKTIELIHSKAAELRSMEELDNSDLNKNKASTLSNQLRYAETSLRRQLAEVFNKYKKVNSLIVNINDEKKKLSESYALYLKSVSELTPKINKALIDHPHKKERLISFKTHIENFDKEYKDLGKVLDNPLKSLTLSDYLTFNSGYKKLGVEKSKASGVSEDYKRMIEQLYTSYSKILIDKNETHGIKLGAVTWDEYYDYPTEHQRTFPYTEVKRSEYERVLSYIGTGRSFRVGTFSMNSITDDSVVSIATGGKSRSGWDSGDTHGEIWLEDNESEYVHYYLIIEDGKTSETEEVVTKKTYLYLEGAMNKEVLSKPYGFFEDEAIDKPQDIGLNYVGNNHYGQWTKDPVSGADIWMWFAAYSIIDDITDNRIDRRRHERYMSSMNSYVPPHKRSGYSYTNSYGVTSKTSPFKTSVSRSKGSTLKGAGSSFRNRGPSSGK